VEELDACFMVRDHGGQALAYVYFEDEQRSSTAFGGKADIGRMRLNLRL
jgi:hypothetical protein